MTRLPARLAVVLSLAVLMVAGAVGGAVAAQTGARVLFRLHDSRLDEVSGLAVGVRSPGVLYAQNDSGDRARFFALNARTGDVVAVETVPGARNVDWEDLAVAPDAVGTSSVWIADTGDNELSRRSVRLYRVDEPRLSASAHGLVRRTARPQVWTLRYPDGPHDTEALAVTPTGRPYLVTKSLSGDSEVFAAPVQPRSGTATLRRIGRIRFTLTGTPGPFGPAGEVAATGAALSQTGSRFVVRTYTDAYSWAVRNGDLAAALSARPTRIALPRQPQGEGVAIDGNRLLVDSEGRGSAVWSVALPPAAPDSAVATVSARGSVPASPSVSPRRSPSGSSGHGAGFFVIAIVVIGFALAGTGLSRRQGGGRWGAGGGRKRRRDQWPYNIGSGNDTEDADFPPDDEEHR